MLPLTIRMHLQTLLIALLISVVYGQDRKIYPKLNPNCTSCGVSDTLVYIKAVGSEDIIHQIWDFTGGLPTVIYAITNLNTTLNVQWNHTKPDIFLSEKPQYCFAFLIDELFEYSDCQDRGHFDWRCPRRSLSLRDVRWSRQDTQLSDQEALVLMRGAYRDSRRTGIIDIKLDVLPFVEYSAELPHLIHSSNSTLASVALVNFTSTLNASRLAIHVILSSTDPDTADMGYTMRKSLDDEHTPGVFEIVEIVTPRGSGGSGGGFVQFRPVAYNEPERSVSSSTNAYDSHFNRTHIPARSTLWRLYRWLSASRPLAQDMVVSFGLPGDGYYRQHNYTSWSFTFGYGRPPAESVSLFVVLVLGLGLAVPLVLALSGAALVVVRRYRRARHPPQPLIDDE